MFLVRFLSGKVFFSTMQRRHFLKEVRDASLGLFACWVGFQLAKYSSGQSIWMPPKIKKVSYLSWLIHPEFDDEKALQMWKEFLSDVKGQNTLTLVSGKPNSRLEDELNALKGQIYYGGWKGYNLSWRVKKALPDYKHLVLGWRMGYCVKSHVDYLLERRVPTQNIHVLSRYSFCCNNPRHIQEAVNYYKRKGMEVLEGRVNELIKSNC